MFGSQTRESYRHPVNHSKPHLLCLLAKPTEFSKKHIENKETDQQRPACSVRTFIKQYSGIGAIEEQKKLAFEIFRDGVDGWMNWYMNCTFYAMPPVEDNMVT